MEPTIIEVGTAEYATATSGQILETKGIGSCIVVCLYERDHRIGALAHMMLSHCEDPTLNTLRFVDTALPLVVQKLVDLGGDMRSIDAHLIGGASMFVDIEDYLKLGEENVKAAEKVLTNLNIPIKSREVGGNIGRSVKFYLDTGEIQVTIK